MTKFQVDLGCGGVKRVWDGYSCYGLDVVGKPKTVADMVCNLGFSPIPMETNIADLVTSYDFLEHVPMCVFADGVRQMPMVFLFNEIYRLLKHQGIFFIQVPAIANINQQFVSMPFSDPTHVSYWTLDTINYFSGDYFSFHDVYGHTSRFECINKQFKGNHLELTLKAIKNLPPEADYKLHYL